MYAVCGETRDPEGEPDSKVLWNKNRKKKKIGIVKSGIFANPLLELFEKRK